MKIDMKQVRHVLERFFKALWGVCSRNLGLKLLSVLFALFLWSYVITSSPLPREKLLTGLDINVTGQTTLSGRRLALLSMPDMTGAQLRVRVSQSSYGLVTADNVRVDLDLSAIRTTGKQSVRLRGTSTYGTAVQVIPEFLEVEVEQDDQRVVPVNVVLTGEQHPDYWYNPSGRTNPSQITVSGPTSIVQTVSSALVQPDVTGRYERYSTALQYVLLDAQGNEVTGPITSPTSSVTVPIDIYPKRVIDVAGEVDDLTRGQVADGYEVISVEASPSAIVVAAEQSLLDTLSELNVEPVDISGMNQTFSAVTRVTSLRGVQHLSSEEVTVTVVIGEKQTTRRFQGIDIDFINPPEGKRVNYSIRRINVVRVTGPVSLVNALTRGDIQATVDLSGLTVGQFEVPVVFSAPDYPDFTWQTPTPTVTVTVSDM